MDPTKIQIPPTQIETPTHSNTNETPRCPNPDVGESSSIHAEHIASMRLNHRRSTFTECDVMFLNLM